MKVLIVCTPRSGTSSFSTSLSKTLNIPLISIPEQFYTQIHTQFINYLIEKPKCIVRLDPTHKIGMDIYDFSKYFDHIVLLTRKNEKDYLISLANLSLKVKAHKFSPHALYSSKDIPEKILNSIDKTPEWSSIKEGKLKINLLARMLKQDILFYEHLFSDNFDIDKFLPFLTSDLKSRFSSFLKSTKKLRINIESSAI